MRRHITEHAYRRAQDRLGLDRKAFEGWLRATESEWLPINASTLYQFGVKASAKSGPLFTTPLTAGTHVAISTAPDGAIKTVMDYRVPVRAESESTGWAQAIFKIAREHERPWKVLAKMIGIDGQMHSGNLNSRGESMCARFARGCVSLDELKQMLRTPPDTSRIPENEDDLCAF